MSTKRIKALRILSAFLLLSMVNQILFPTVAFALTSMDTQPEVWGYQPVDATDNVSLGSGGFSYNVPITSIPEYPMAIGYNAGLGMDQEASCFGFGFNGFTGAITRTVRGLPDDVNGVTKRYGFGNEPVKDINTTIGFNLGYSVSNSIQIGFNATSLFGFNNYTGGYGGIGIGLGVGLVQRVGGGKNMGGGASLGAGIQFMNDSRETAPRIGAGAGLGIGMGTKKYSQGLSLGGVYATKSLSNGSKWQTGKTILKQQIGINSFPATTRNATSSMGPLASVYPKQGGSRLTMGFSIYLFSFGTSWAKYKYPQPDVNKIGYGFMYLNNYDRSKTNDFADMTVEGEDSFNESSYNNPSYLQKDDYVVNTMGISGGMELYQKSYGVVSRNTYTSQTNERKTYKTKSLFREVHPWSAVNQTSQNKSVDILALLKDIGNLAKDSETNDITNSAYQFFSEDEKESLNTDSHRFNSDPEFKMRGDYAGEYDLASDDFKDHEVNRFDMIHISGTGEKAKFARFGREKNVPLYYPAQPRDYDGYANTHPIERSTQITKHTIGEMLMDGYLNNADPQGGSVTDPASPYYSFNIAQSMYTYYDYVPANDLAIVPTKLNEHLVKKNIINELHDLRDRELADKKSSYVNNLIGGLDIQSTNGLRYYFNLPVFNKSSRNQELLGHGYSAPIKEAGDYHSYKRDGSHYERNKTDVNDEYIYPYAWLITAIVGEDYIDFDNIPGPSDGDIGYWVKFRYVKAADKYRWRTPFTGMNHFEGLLQVTDDDIYSVASGEKEIYYVSEIESSHYLCKYQYQKRYDAIDAASFDNGNAHNTIRDAEPGLDKNNLGTHYQFAVTQIDLYKKHSNGNNSATVTEVAKKKIKSTIFSYDYSTSSLVPNSMGSYPSYYTINKTAVPYHIPGIATPDCSEEPPQGASDTRIGSGKLTLRRVQDVAYDENEVAVSLPSYTFNYYGDCKPEYNPAYNRNAVDQWGNYMASSVDIPTVNNSNNLKYYHHYTENMKDQADENARVFKLKNIHLPSGGHMNINYQAQSYGFVENQVPFAMRHVTEVQPDGDGYTLLKVDVSDCPEGLKLTKTRDGLNNEVPLLSEGEQVYGELTFYRNTLPGKEDAKNVILISEESIVSTIYNPEYDTNDGKYYQKVRLTAITGTERPFIDQCQNYMYFGSNEARAIGDEVNSTSPCDETVQVFLDRYEDLYRDVPTDAIRKIIAHGNHMVRSDIGTKNRFNSCFGEPATKVYAHQSFLRARVNKAKYTGAVVSSVILKDGFNYASTGTIDNPGVTSKDNEYGKRYYYDLNGDGNGTSSGVATSEPGGGKSCVLDPNATTGAGFMASPSITYSRTTLENNYEQAALGATKAPRKKGKTAYEFYTAKDEGYQFASNFKQEQTYDNPGPLNGNFFLFGVMTFLKLKFKLFGKTITIKIPHLVPIVLKWDLKDRYHTRSYAYTDHTDMFGRVKAIHQLDASGQELGSQTYNYFGKDEGVKMYNKGFQNSSLKRPGKMDQIWSEAYYTKEDEIQLIAALYLQAKCEKNYNYTTMKYSYIPPVLKEVVSNMDGLKMTATNLGFDYLTGMAVEVKRNDSYNNEKIIRTVPAYWVYAEMGVPTVSSPGNINNLIESTASYTYLQSADDTHVLSASVSKQTSSKSGTWNTTPYLQPQLFESNVNESRYYYTPLASNTIRNAYALTSGNKFIKHYPVIYKPYETYTYEVPLNDNGTFKTFTNFNFLTGTTNPTWKKVNTNELYAQNGMLVQSKDVLSKYSSELMGYNCSNTIATASNSTWAGAAYEGAENTYAKATGALMLEDDKVKLQEAKVIKACVPTYITREFNLSEMNFGDIITVKVPTTYTPDVPFTGFTATFVTGVVRNFYVSINSNKEFEIVTNKGESFEGFVVLKQLDGTFKLIFNDADFSSVFNNIFSPSPGFIVSYVKNEAIPPCVVLPKKYKIPVEDCIGQAHTGSYAFVLDGNKTGTEFTLSTNTLSANELKRKYKALVWVHKSSTDKTELVMQVTNSSGAVDEFKTSKLTPYVVAGEWILLRLDVDLSTIPNSSVARVFVRNASQAGQSIYDDYRVLPYHADMNNWVFDHQFNRVVSGLDIDNYASYSEYDARGRVTASSMELQNEGKKLVQKFLHNDQKKN